jgi:steroid 5-alpha reductase family enzyme
LVPEDQTVIVLEIATVALGLSLVLMFAWWMQRRTGKSGWIDTIWSLATAAGGVIFSIFAFVSSGSPPGRALLVGAMVAGWGLRLGSHIASRTMRGGDDPRYADLKREWGDDFPRRLFWFLQIQAASALLLAISVFAAARNPAMFPNLFDALGVTLFAIALAGESAADRQLRNFAANPSNKGRVCDIGLWGWSRHPNYFFEWLTWLSYALIAIDISGQYLWGLAAFAGPLFMYWLLVHVSGIPPLEAHMARSRGDAFKAYQARVNAFFPGPARQ